MREKPEEIVDDGEEELAEIRRIRHEISARFDHDPHRLVAYIMEQERMRGGELIYAPGPGEHGDPAAA